MVHPLLPLILLSGAFAQPALATPEKRVFSLASRATNIDGSVPTYKNPEASIEDRVNDLLPRMTIEEKVSQL